jgi:hypothetical protein
MRVILAECLQFITAICNVPRNKRYAGVCEPKLDVARHQFIKKMMTHLTPLTGEFYSA